ncbi:MAG: protein TolQ [Desulfobacterales bacterium]|nr:protein TolQ [Desulfobacterales bacterium]
MVAESSLNLLSLIAQAGWVVKLVLMILFLFSVTSWSIIFYKFFIIRRVDSESTIFVDIFWKSPNLSDAFVNSKHLRASSIARVFHTAYLELKKGNTQTNVQGSESGQKKASLGTQLIGIENVKRTLRRSIDNEVTRLSDYVSFLATAGNTSPFIGLFGTVWGIMDSFHGIGLKGQASLAVVAPGISEALVATAVGLAVAIPSVIAFNFFTQKIKNINSEMQSFSSDFLNIVERSIRIQMENR